MRGPTLRDVAALAQVHAGTASRALDPERSSLVTAATRDRVLAAAKELGYRGNALARGLRTGRSGVIAVVAADIGNPFVPPVLRGVEQEVVPAGFTVLVSETLDQPGALERITDYLVTSRVDAIVLLAARLEDEAHIRSLEQVIPVVLAVRSVSGSGHQAVVHDDVLGGRTAAQHLVDLGHAKLAQLRGPAGVSSFVGRTRGFDEVVAESLAVDRSPAGSATEPTVAEGHRLMDLVLDGPRSKWPTAVFAQNDMLAVGALESVAAHGLTCPGDISVVGYNDSPLTDHVSPPLTTVRLPSPELGRTAARMALAKIRGTAGRPGTVKLAPELVLRESTRRRRRPTRRPA
jgi:LacI family transcriptional regulator